MADCSVRATFTVTGTLMAPSGQAWDWLSGIRSHHQADRVETEIPDILSVNPKL